MDRPSDSQTTVKKVPPPASSSPRTSYLIGYNAVSATLWAIVLVRVCTTAATEGPKAVFASTGPFVTWTQTLAVLEIAHSLIGVVRAPLLTTAMQVASRLLLVWGIAYPFPRVVEASNAFASMLVAWSATEVVRYSFFALQLARQGRVPAALLWLRYNTFFALYPLGIASECWLVWSCVRPAADAYGRGFAAALVAILLIYVPGSYVLFTYMMAQRRKVLGTAGSTKKSR